MIGETLYTHDGNRRVYTNDDGTSRISPNPQCYWEAHVVTGETKTSWILDDGVYKADKKTLELRGIREFYSLARRAFTEADKADCDWRDENYRRIVKAVETANIATLRRIDAILNAES